MKKLLCALTLGALIGVGVGAAPVAMADELGTTDVAAVEAATMVEVPAPASDPQPAPEVTPAPPSAPEAIEPGESAPLSADTVSDKGNSRPVAKAAAAAASAVSSSDPEDGKKVWVCKYVGTPGVSERLQTGNNPIAVSVNTLPAGFSGAFPYEFGESQGRSVAIGFYGRHDAEPSRDDCLEAQGPAPLVTTEPGQWTDGAWVCGDTTVTRTRSVTTVTTPYRIVGDDWVLDLAHRTSTTTTETGARALTADELASCQSPPPQPGDDRETRPAAELSCRADGTGEARTWSEERTRTYTLVDGVWTAGAWSDWTVVAGSLSIGIPTATECPSTPPQPAADRETRPASDVQCVAGTGNATTTTWTEERTRTYYLLDGRWVAGEWSAWAEVDGTRRSELAPSGACPPPDTVEVTFTAWADGTWLCGDTRVEQTRTKITTTTSSVFLDGAWVPGDAPLVATENQSQTRPLTQAEIGTCPLLLAGTAAVCVADAPYLSWDVALPNGFVPRSDTPLTVTFLHPTDPSQNVVWTGLGLNGVKLWPGAGVDPAAWPGWARVDGEWVNIGDGNFGWTRNGVTVRFDVNPTNSTTITYPAATSECANPMLAPSEDTDPLPEGVLGEAVEVTEPGDPTAVLAYTGMDDELTGLYAVAALVLVGTGITLRRFRR